MGMYITQTYCKSYGEYHITHSPPRRYIFQCLEATWMITTTGATLRRPISILRRVTPLRVEDWSTAGTHLQPSTHRIWTRPPRELLEPKPLNFKGCTQKNWWCTNIWEINWFSDWYFLGCFFFGIATDGPLGRHVVHFFSGSVKTGDIPRCWDKLHINLVAPKILDCIGCCIGTWPDMNSMSLFRSFMKF